MVKFKELVVGDTFDWVDDTKPADSSFYNRCTKVSTRGYEWQGRGLSWHRNTVGSVNVEVFHVNVPPKVL